MIRKWLIKHWWVNESGKILAAGFFGYMAYRLYFDSFDTAFIAGFFAGLLSLMCGVIFVDTFKVLVCKIKGKEPYQESSPQFNSVSSKE